jgi:integrase
MSVYKPKGSKYYKYDFWMYGEHYRGPTKQTVRAQAKLFEGKKRVDLSRQAFGLAPDKIAPLFQTFMEQSFLPHVREQAAENVIKKSTLGFYEEKTLRLLEWKPWLTLRLTEIDEELIAKYKTWRLSRKARRRLADAKMKPASVNRELATLKRALHLAAEWKLISRPPAIHIALKAETGRKYVLTGDVENAYLAKLTYPLREATILMIDLGLRPHECVGLRKADVIGDTVHVRAGKTGPRALLQTARTRRVFQTLAEWFPDSEWVFPGRKAGAHLSRVTLTSQNRVLRQQHDLPAELVPYSCRHTFGTRLAESGAGAFEIMDSMGHSSIVTSQKYIRLSAAHLSLALRRKEMYDNMLRGESPMADVDAIPTVKE